jgi:hypothetical protein
MSSDMLLSISRGERVRIVRATIEANEDPLVLERLSMILRMGEGSCHTSVGTASEVLFADLLEIAKGGDRVGSRHGDIEAQVSIRGRCCDGFALRDAVNVAKVLGADSAFVLFITILPGIEAFRFAGAA